MRWLELIHARMTGLRSIIVIIHLSRKSHLLLGRVPQIGDPWVPQLLKLRQSATGSRRAGFFVDSGGLIMNDARDTQYLQEAGAFATQIGAKVIELKGVYA